MTKDKPSVAATIFGLTMAVIICAGIVIVAIAFFIKLVEWIFSL